MLLSPFFTLFLWWCHHNILFIKMSSVQCSQCQQWFSNHRNLMFHMASCPAKYRNNDDTLELLGHNPLKSSYDLYTSTNIAVPCINDDTAFLFEVERNEIEGIDDDISSRLRLCSSRRLGLENANC